MFLNQNKRDAKTRLGLKANLVEIPHLRMYSLPTATGSSAREAGFLQALTQEMPWISNVYFVFS